MSSVKVQVERPRCNGKGVLNSKTNLSYAAIRTLQNLSTKRARSLKVAMEKAGYSRFSVDIPRELFRAGVIKSCGPGYAIRVA